MYITLEAGDIIEGVIKKLSIIDPDIPWSIITLKELIDSSEITFDLSVYEETKKHIQKHFIKWYDIHLQDTFDIIFIGLNSVIINCPCLITCK